MNTHVEPPLINETCTDGVLRITLQNGRAHALSRAMISALHGALDRAAGDADVRVILIDGPGHIFCAGHDLKEIARHRSDADKGAAYITDLFEACGAMMVRLAQLTKPTIAMVDGIATAAGLQMVASCDLAFVSPRATFCLPGINNGGFCTTPAVAVSRSIGQKPLMDLMLSGEAKDADWALAAGLVTRVIDGDALEAETLSFAARLATRNPGPIAAGKAALQTHLGLPLDQAYDVATPVMISHFMDPGRQAQERDSKFR